MIERVEIDGALIIVGSDAAEVGQAVRATPGAGRIGALIGVPGEPPVRAALDEMRNELFGT